MLKIGIIREWKLPADKRVVLSPKQCASLLHSFPLLQIKAESSPDRIFSDDEYRSQGIEVSENMTDCDILLGIKEVPPDRLIPNKTYFFFAHIIKKQPYNQGLMKALIEKKIRMIDFEMLTDSFGKRLIGFGKYAGIVGAYNGLLTWGKKHRTFTLTPAHKLRSYNDLVAEAKSKAEGACKIVLTGTGRVGKGALKLLNDLGIKQVSPQEYLENHSGIVFTHLGSKDLYMRQSDGGFDSREFHTQPHTYKTAFTPYLSKTDLLMNGVFWNEKIPRLFEKEAAQSPDFRISVIADISCDVDGSVPITLKATDIYNPVFGIDRKTLKETAPFLPETIDVMAVSNLPTEQPKDASVFFGKTFCKYILPELLSPEKSDTLHRATICKNGKLNKGYEYLREYAEK